MRRRITLYIGDMAADLDDQTFILFNWTAEEMEEPTAVKNSWSQQVTLPGTAANGAIFGHFFRLDRSTQFGTGFTGAEFDPSRKTPFTIYSEAGEVLQSGYLKLDSVACSGSTVSYKVTLYGGLGSFLYGLTYDGEGNSMTLADLSYLGYQNPDTELDFRITADAVLQAWQRAQQTTPSQIWDVINFAPCYNGIPDGDFSADKAVAVPSDIGLANSVTSDGTNYLTKDGHVLLNFPSEHTEWEVRDLRSYLQRPVLSINAFLRAVVRTGTSLGFTVDTSGLTRTDGTPFFRDIWMTLPQLTELTPQGVDGEVDSTVSAPQSQDFALTVTPDDSYPSGTELSAEVTFTPRFSFLNFFGAGSPVYPYVYDTSSYCINQVLFFQLVAYDAQDEVCGGGQTQVLFTDPYGRGFTASQLGSVCVYDPLYTVDEDTPEYAGLSSPSYSGAGTGNIAEASLQVTLSGQAQDAVRFAVIMKAYTVRYSAVSPLQLVNTIGQSVTGLDFYAATTAGSRAYSPTTASVADAQGVLSAKTPDGIRSGSKVTKAILLSTDGTPADYLLSLAKMYGIRFLYDPEQKKVSLVWRDASFGGDPQDISARIDRSKDITVTPYSFSAKFYDMELENDGGEYMERYSELYGRVYGSQRIDTGYDFDGDTVNIMDGLAFRGAVCALESSSYFCDIMQNGAAVPSVFIDQGVTATYWSSTGDSIDASVVPPDNSAQVTWWNASYRGYDRDGAAKMQMHDSDGGPLEGTGVLVLRDGTSSMPGFKVSDDSAAMMSLNDNTPCWDMTPGDGVTAPNFRSLRYSGGQVTESTDFGVPQSLAVPGITYPEEAALYTRFWKAYLRDRYDVDTKVVECTVDLRGMDVGQPLLGRFWWFGNAVWVLNKITDYSMTTWDNTECEFVKVKDMDDYTEGQIKD